MLQAHRDVGVQLLFEKLYVLCIVALNSTFLPFTTSPKEIVLYSQFNIDNMVVDSSILHEHKLPPCQNQFTLTNKNLALLAATGKGFHCGGVLINKDYVATGM